MVPLLENGCVKKILMASVIAVGSMLSLAAQADGPIRLAFIDTGNTGRSVTAEALANAMAQQKKLDIVVISRAVELNPYNIVPEHDFATQLLERGIDVSTHRAVQVTANDIKFSDLILTMTDKHRDTILALYPQAKGKIFTISDYATGQSVDVTDAYRQPKAVYDQVFQQIDGYMPAALEKATKKN